MVKKIIIGCYLLALAGYLHAQQPELLLDTLSTRYPQEKVYLHFDRSYYNSGETIWFKAYLTAANLPSTISKTLYADLMDGQGNILQRKTMPVIQSVAASGFDIPDSIHVPVLYIRAYTSWMLNFDSSQIFLKSIPLLNVRAKKQPPMIPSYSLHFFPEGGDLVLGVPSRLAFKADNQASIPFSINGKIIDEKGNTVISFASVHDGMGYVNFTPLPGKKYTASWKDPKHIPHTTLLPEVKEQGVVLRVDNNNNQVTFTLSRPDSAEDAFTFFYVVAQMQQQLMYSASVNMATKTLVKAPIVTDSFPDGILQITVFNKQHLPVAERILFINHGNYYFNTDLHAVEKDLGKRKRNVLQIDVGGTLFSSLSVAVTDADLNQPPANEETIFSSLLLTSDLKGYVYNPAYYFSSDEDSVKQHLDLVMMTNGWRRFKWENVLAGHWPDIHYKPENYLTVQGNVYGLSGSLLYGKEVTAFLKTKNRDAQMYVVPVMKDGTFKISNLYFYDTARIYYQLNNDKDKTLTSAAGFSFHSPFVSPEIVPFQAPFTREDVFPDSTVLKRNRDELALRKNATDLNKTKVLADIVVTTHQKSLQEKMDEEYTSGLFSGGDAHTFILQNDPSAAALNVLSYLQGKIAGLTIYVNGSQSSATWRGSTPTFYINEMQSDISAMQSISVSDIAMIKVFQPPFMGGLTGGEGGAIAIYTKKGGDFSSVKGLDYSLVTGYSSMKEFYAPDYAQPDPEETVDFRNTLYWNPLLFLDSRKRRITIPFYNNDRCKRFLVIIEGMNENGQLTREEKIFE